MLAANETDRGNHFTIYVSQTIMLYDLNSYGDVMYISIKLEKKALQHTKQWKK